MRLVIGYQAALAARRRRRFTRRENSMVTLSEWNVVASTGEGMYKKARAVLTKLGKVGDTPYHNVLVMWVADVHEALEALRSLGENDPKVREWVRHFVPVSTAFWFMSPEQFEAKATEALNAFLPQLTGKSFYVRMHRRGFKGRLAQHEEERMLGEVILGALAARGAVAHVAFEDPDAVVVIETVGQRAGLALWTREELERYPFLHVKS
jgi:tRNA(Ser,Leu) C12 N-acetylase TAN1